ncbi:hypothetical protein [Pedobacter borealis]|uniref:hypothetical protein n=1 Tax=Pedobacter borealis TaxID=475254 RepID=UPI0004939FBA|nr:hypothetical protein [Pedobacter borealis]
MNEFKLFDRIINGDLRPQLEKFSDADGIEALHTQFYRRNIILTQENIETILTQFPEGFFNIKDGDKVEFEMDPDAEKPGITLRVLPNESEQELINLDIPPPPDEKSETFLNIIEDEYGRLKQHFHKKLSDNTSADELKMYILKNVQQAKLLAKSTYQLKRKLRIENIDDYNNPNTFIMDVLGKHLVYLIIDVQELFFPMLAMTIQDESELEDELFDHQYSRKMARVKLMDESINNKYIERLRSEIPKSATPAEKCVYWEKKLNEQLKKIEEAQKSQFGANGFVMKPYNLFKGEYASCLYDFYYEKLITNSSPDGLIGKYEHAIQEVARLRTDRRTLETQALQKSDFFEKMQIHIDILKERISVSYSAATNDNILSDLTSFAITIQARKHLKLKEDQWNDYLTDLLRAKQYHVSDQTRSGRSGSSATQGYQSGNLDIAIRDNRSNGIIRTIVETMQIDSCGYKDITVKHHINKLLNRYDTAGNHESFVVILSRAVDFDKHWERYKSYVHRIAFDSKVFVSDIINDATEKTDVKIGCSIIERSAKKIKLFHLFVNMYCE